MVPSGGGGPLRSQLLSVVLLFFVFSTSSSGSLGGEYNDVCELYDETSSCDHSKGLMCLQSLPGSAYKCKCPSGGPSTQFSTTYDSTRSRCVGKVFNTCVRSSTSRLHESSGSPNHTDVYFCVANADCDHSVYHLPLCICRKGFYATDEGFCAPTAKYGSPCDNVTSRCDERHGLLCSNLTSPPTCQCKDNVSQLFSPQDQVCVTLVHGECSPDEKDSSCVPHAACMFSPERGGASPGPNRPIVFRSPSEDSHKPLFPMMPGASGHRRTPPGTRRDVRSVCECLPGFSPTKTRRCLRSHGAICDPQELRPSEHCNSEEFLECVDSDRRVFQCGCRNRLNERWDPQSRRCLSRLGRHCRPNSDFYPPCEWGAECSASTSLCTCKKGSSPTPHGTCALDYTEKCGPGECNAFKGLACHGKTGSCLCVDSFLTYSPKNGGCLAGRNSPCGPLLSAPPGQPTSPPTLTPFIHCEEGLVCRTPQNEESFLQFTCVNKTI